MKKTFFAALALVCMASCDNQVIENPAAEEEYGYISLGVGADTEMVVTRAATTLSPEQLANYNLSLAVKGGATKWESVKYSEVIAGAATYLKQPAGTYTMTATNLTEEEAYALNDGKGVVRVSGTGEVTVVAGQNRECAIECNPINSKVSFRYTKQFAEAFAGNKTLVVSCPDGGDDSYRIVNNLAMSEGEVDASTTGNEDVAYFEAGKTLTWTLSAAKTDVTKNYTNTFVTKAATWTVVTFDLGSTAGVIDVTITVNDEITTVEHVKAEVDPFEVTE